MNEKKMFKNIKMIKLKIKEMKKKLFQKVNKKQFKI
jgi:hypothetical protein